MKKMLIFAPLFSFLLSFSQQKGGGYMAIFLAATGQQDTIKKGNGYSVYLVTNGQFVNLETLTLETQIFPAVVDIKSMADAKIVSDELKVQPADDPYVVLVRPADSKSLRKLRKTDPAQMEEAYIIQNWSQAVPLSKFIAWQKKMRGINTVSDSLVNVLQYQIGQLQTQLLQKNGQNTQEVKILQGQITELKRQLVEAQKSNVDDTPKEENKNNPPKPKGVKPKNG